MEVGVEIPETFCFHFHEMNKLTQKKVKVHLLLTRCESHQPLVEDIYTKYINIKSLSLLGFQINIRGIVRCSLTGDPNAPPVSGSVVKLGFECSSSGADQADHADQADQEQIKQIMWEKGRSSRSTHQIVVDRTACGGSAFFQKMTKNSELLAVLLPNKF
ncbi:LOW QUALITY PROTEIN: hypothetical protein YC2023_047597 [Brassica napus]